MIEGGEEDVILWHILVGDAGPKIGQLQITHLLPIDDMRVEVVTAVIDDPLDVRDRKLAVPAGVDMHDQGPHAPFAQLERKIRAVHAAAEAQDAVVPLTRSSALYLGEPFLKAGRSLRVREPHMLAPLVEIVAMITDAVPVELNLRIAAVHDTAGADPVGRRRCSGAGSDSC